MTEPYALIPGGRHGCPQCPDRFDTVGDKRRHLRKKHPRTTDQTSTINHQENR